jgi:hypothetical protein
VHSSVVVRPVWFAVALTMAGCTQWHPESVGPSELVNSTHPARLRVTARDSTSTIVEAPTVTGDTLRGRVHGNPWAIALPDVAEVAVQRVHGAHSALLIGGLAAVTAGTIAVMTESGGPDNLRLQ